MQLRDDVIEGFLAEAIEIANISLLTKVAKNFLSNQKKDTYTLLDELFSLTSSVDNNRVNLTLYNVIIEYARLHGIPQYIAKPSLQKYLIERQDLKNMEESFKIGEEVLHYVNFLSEEEKIVLYFRMALQAYAIKKYEKCIELCEAGLPLEKKDTELKARAYLALINSNSRIGNYDNVEKYLEVFERFQYDFVQESTMITRSITKVRKKEYEAAIPMLKSCIEKLSRNNKIHVVNELFEIYVHQGTEDSIHNLINRESELLPNDPHTPYKLASIGRFYRQKGAFQIKKGLTDEGIESYINSLSAYGEINALGEITECLHDILFYFSKSSRSIDLPYVEKLEKVYNGITVNNRKREEEMQ